MKKKYLSLALVLMLVLSAFALSACSNEEEPAESEDNNEPATEAVTGTVMVAAAASLENALVEELIPLFNETNPDVEVSGTYDSSGKLQEQIEGGLEASIFMSAATKQMDALVEGGYIDEGNVVNALENDVVLIKGVNGDTSVTSFEDITNAETVAIGDPASVPAGQYAEEALTNLGVWEDVSAKASLGTNVTEVLNWVAEGSAEVGIVYATDAASMPDGVEVIATAPEDALETPVIYPIGMLNEIAEENQEASQLFYDFLQSDEALAIFEEYGFKIA